MISMVQPLFAGNALRLFVVPPAGASTVRILRRTTDAFTGPADAGAYRVTETLDHVFVDTKSLINGQTYFYKPYALIGATWVPGPTVSGVPSANYEDWSVAVVEFVRERLAAGLLVEIQRNALSHVLGKIPVLIASPTFEDTKWPVVTIHVAADSSDMRWLGEMAEPDWFDVIGDEWVGTEGWLSRIQLTITGWAINADVRAALRKAIKRIVIANLPVFDAQGMYQVSINQQDLDDFQTYSAPVYQSLCQFSCFARSAVTSVEGPIREILVSPAPIP